MRLVLQAKQRLTAMKFKKEDFKPGQHWVAKYDYGHTNDGVTEMECTIDKVRARGCAVTWKNGNTTWEVPFTWFNRLLHNGS